MQHDKGASLGMVKGAGGVAWTSPGPTTTPWCGGPSSRRSPAALARTFEPVAAPRSVRGYEYALGELIQHLLNHSTYHRGQVALLLRQLGQSPPATDFRLFLTESRYGATY